MFGLDHFVLATMVKGMFKNCRSVYRKTQNWDEWKAES